MALVSIALEVHSGSTAHSVQTEAAQLLKESVEEGTIFPDNQLSPIVFQGGTCINVLLFQLSYLWGKGCISRIKYFESLRIYILFKL